MKRLCLCGRNNRNLLSYSLIGRKTEMEVCGGGEEVALGTEWAICSRPRPCSRVRTLAVSGLETLQPISAFIFT